MKKKKFRVFLGLSEIAGNFSRLKIGLTSLGHEVFFYAPSGHLYSYPGIDAAPLELNILFEQEYLRIMSRRELMSSRVSAIRLVWRFKLVWWKLKNICKFIFFAKKFDVFIFHYGNSFHWKALLVHFDDLFWLRFIRRKIIFLYCGSDSRPAWIDGAIAHSVPNYDAKTLAEISKNNAENNIGIERAASYIISNVFSSYFFTRQAISLQAIGNAAHIPSKPKPPPMRKAPVIVHAPSRSDAKGTAEIVRCIEELRAEGLEMTLIILQGKNNSEILEALDNCDFVIDQLYSDLPLATFASEAAGYGKPSIVGTYIPSSEYATAYGVHGVPPSAICHPDDLKAAVRTMVCDVEKRVRLGLDAREYVQRVLSPEIVAQRYIKLFRGEVPREWIFDPKSISIAPPVGMPASLATRLLRESKQFHSFDYYFSHKVGICASLARLEKGENDEFNKFKR
ncbi:MAG: glycosyltransferase [Acidovorax temperans]|uniref:glycosyltransferase n=1 Tax=Acidovorax temperans TaxID=80878 RepID=UPI0039194191